MKGDKGGIPRIFFLIVVFLLGVLVWVYLQTLRKDYTQTAVNFDGALAEFLVKSGIKDSDIASQSRTEKASATHLWVEYYMEINLPAGTDPARLREGIRSAADGAGLTYADKVSDRASLIEVTFRKILLSKIVLKYAPAKPAAAAHRVAIVIDDVGYRKNLAGFLEIGIPITFAILPKEAHSRDDAKELSALNNPYLLHMPMEPEKYPKENPGKAAILLKMGPAEIRKMVESDLASVPGACGVNNHMGSAFTADAAKMKVFLSVLKEKRLFFLDSYTSQKTQGAKAAAALGVPVLENRVFLDLKEDPASVRAQLDELLRLAQKRPKTVAIGHVQHPGIIPALKEYIPKFKEKGIVFVYLPDLLK